MVSNWRSKATVSGSTFLLWALVAGSAAYWSLRFSAAPAVMPPPAAVAGPAAVDPLSIARLLGSSPVASPSAPPLASRFALQGVVADGGHGGAALISIDGKPPKPFRVGAAVDEGLVLQSVEARRAVLGHAQGPATVTLDLPRPGPVGASLVPSPNAIPAIPAANANPPMTGAPPGAVSPAPVMPGAQAPMAAPR